MHLICAAQVKNSGFTSIDKRVKSINIGEPGKLSRALTNPYKTEIEKTRAIFRWITENIAYDVQGAKFPNLIYRGLKDNSIQNDSLFNRDYNLKIVLKILTERKAICDGYSRLFKTLCDSAKIKCVIISGNIRWHSDQIGTTTNRRHAWNAVFINNKWHLIDATWASGYWEESTDTFVKKFEDFFFFTDPIDFFNDHFPDDSKWSLLPNTPTLSQFFNFPFIYPEFYNTGITSLKPLNGTISIAKSAPFVNIEMEVKKPVESVEVIEYPQRDDTANDYVDNSPIEYSVQHGKLVIQYKILSEKTERIDIRINDERVLTYAIHHSW
ncbi:MAG: transglutaminase domain-containing protein [Chitinophagaceae bacterium]